MRVFLTELCDKFMPPSNMMVMLCILALLPLAESSAPPPTPSLADALAKAHMADSEVVARVLTEVVRINPTRFAVGGGWLADLRGFDGPERKELSDLLRGEGVGLGDRSKLRRLATVTVDRNLEDDTVRVSRRALQQADPGREESATNAQLKKQQGDHAGAAQPSSKQADSGSGFSGDSASPCIKYWHISLSHRSLYVHGAYLFFS